jgi:hypothetical protein
MNALPGALFLFRRKTFTMITTEKRLWTWLAIASLGLLVLLAVTPSSTALDRVGLYLMPLQLAVFAHLPLVYQSSASADWLKRLAIVYFAAVLFVWLYFATHAHAWLPYQNFIVRSLML